MNISQTKGSSGSLALLAPASALTAGEFQKTSNNYSLHHSFMAGMQRLRGGLYLRDGAISAAALTDDGRHVLPADYDSWHLLTLDAEGDVVGCARYLVHPETRQFDGLRVSSSPLAYCKVWGARLEAAVVEDMQRARVAGFSYVELGGWALADKLRGTSECLRSVLAAFAWGRMIGGVIGISTATERNGSASILRRLGASLFKSNEDEIPAFYDPHYKCQMQMLRFDSRDPNPRYENSIQKTREYLGNIPVICPQRPAWQTVFNGYSLPSVAQMPSGAPIPLAA